jgi:hypothetical protein
MKETNPEFWIRWSEMTRFDGQYRYLSDCSIVDREEWEYDVSERIKQKTKDRKF